MSFRLDRILVALDVDRRFRKRCVRHRGDHSCRPVEILCGNFLCGVRKVFRSLVNSRIERDQRIERVGRECKPLDCLAVCRNVRAHLDQSQEIVAVDPDRAVFALLEAVPALRIRVERSSLEMGGKCIFDILDCHLLLRHHAPRDIIGLRRIVRIRSIPLLCMRVKVAAHEPCSRSIVDVIGITVASKRSSRIKMTAISAV